MTPTQLTYPQFAPNQVLSNTSLNDLFAYLDDQTRLTRTNLIGIGVACGLEASFGEGENGFGILISHGVGVTSAGYLAHWDEDEVLEFYAPYAPPENIEYPFFNDPATDEPYQLWELTPGRADNPAAEQLSRTFLSEQGQEKALLLLVECKVLDNKNCAPNNCDDKGRTVETTLRPVLIAVSDLVAIRERLIETNTGAAEYYSLFANRAGRLSLPTLRAPRYDVTRTNLVSTRDVFRAYQRILSASFLSRVQNTLDDAYDVLTPLLPNYDTNPFASLLTRLSFLHNGRMLRDENALAYQYYYDHLMTVIQAYQELRERAESLFSLCCPDGRIFPRHLALHNFSGTDIRSEVRHDWVSSPVQNQQNEARDELRSLFDRLVVLLTESELPEPGPIFSFTGTLTAAAARDDIASLVGSVAVAKGASVASAGNTAVLAANISGAAVNRNLVAKTNYRSVYTGGGGQANASLNNSLFNASLNTQLFAAYQPSFLLNKALLKSFTLLPPRLKPIRITPTFWGKPLSHKAIPYHYDPTSLLQVWDYAKTRVGRADQNLGFDAEQWNNTDDFVVSPLNYDLEPHDFLRVEGAVGQPYVAVLRELNEQIRTNRLPLDVVALRTGSLTDTLEIEDYELHFADLDALYCNLRERMLGRLAGIAARLYDLKITGGDDGRDPFVNSGPPTLSLLQRINGYEYAADTVGASYEERINRPFTFVSFGLFNFGFTFFGFDFFSLNQEIHGILDRMVRVADNIPEDLRAVSWEALRTLLTEANDFYRSKWRNYAVRLESVLDQLDGEGAKNNHEFVSQLQAVIAYLDDLLTSGDAEELEKLIRQADERRESILKRQLLSGFQQEHPGLQFKAGAPLGGTLVIVYHGDRVEDVPTQTGRFQIYGEVTQGGDPVAGARILAVRNRAVLSRPNGSFLVNVNQLPTRLTVSYEQQQIQIWVTNTEEILEIDLNNPEVFDADRPIPGIEEGTVIADFFLPYRCCGKGAPVHIFPPEPVVPPVADLEATGTQRTCSKQETEGLYFADVQLRIVGGTPPYSLEDANGNGGATAIDGQTVNLASNIAYRISDSQGQAVPLNVQLTPPILVSIDANFRCVEDNEKVERTFRISGGKPPYTVVDDEGREQNVSRVGVGTVRVKAGAASFIEVRDQYGSDCEQSWDIDRAFCEPNRACDLPCGGLALIGKHPVYLPPLERETTTYNLLMFRWIGVEIDGFTLDANQLKPINLQIEEKIKELNPIKITTYSDTIAFLNELLQVAVRRALNFQLGLPEEEAPLLLTIGEETSLLSIEHFSCHKFQLKGEIGYEILENEKPINSLDDVFTYGAEVSLVRGKESFVKEPESRDRCDKNAKSTALTKPSDKPKGTVTSRKQPDGGFLLAVKEVATESEVRWILPPDVQSEKTADGLRLILPEGRKKAEIKLLITDPRTGALTVRKKTIKA